MIDLIENPANDVCYSVANLWEIAIKTGAGGRGRESMGITVSDAAAEFAAASFVQLPIRVEHLRVVSELPAVHGDPFDRLLVAQAEAESMHLVTHDRTLHRYGGLVILV